MIAVGNKAICILGMHRSGTSLVTNIVNKMGVYLGGNDVLMRPVEGVNPDGFWEQNKIVSINDNILKYFNVSWENTIPLPNEWWKQKNISVFENDLYNCLMTEFSNQPLWGWKDPRTCITVPVWLKTLHKMDTQPYFIIVFRNPLDTAKSLKKRDGMPLEQGLRLWYYYNISALEYTNGFKRIFIDYDMIIGDPVLFVSKIKSFISEFYLNEKLIKLEEIVKPSLRNNFSNISEINCIVDEPIKSLYQYLKERTNSDKEVHSSANDYKLIEYQKFANLMNVSKVDEKAKALYSNLYYDIGQGYNEKNAISKVLNFDDPINLVHIEFKLYKNIKKLRWDPVEGHFCSCKILRITTNLGEIEVTENNTNCWRCIEGKYIFLDKDPAIEIEGDFDKIEHLIITAEIEILTVSYVSKLLIDDSNQNELLNCEINNLKNKVSNLLESNDDLKKDIDNFEKSNDNLKQDIEILEKSNKELIEVSMSYKNKEEILLKQLQSKEDEIADFKKSIFIIMNSTSWKITKPIRIIGDFHKYFKQKYMRLKEIINIKYSKLNENSEFIQTTSNSKINNRNRPIVLIISHTNYLNAMGGTEKYIFEQAQYLELQGFDILHLYPGQRNSFLSNKTGEVYGINFANQTIGYYKIDAILKYIDAKKEHIDSAYIHHLIYWQYIDAVTILEYMSENKIKMIKYIHDFFVCCPHNEKVFKDGQKSCIENFDLQANSKWCLSCKIEDEREEWKECFEHIFSLVDSIIVPSEYVKKIASSEFPLIISKINVKGHLKFETPRIVKKEKIRIAYLGYKATFKGWGVWEKIYNNHDLEEEYQFFHIGSNNNYSNKVTACNYSFIENGTMAAVDELIKNRIDLVLLWSVIPESYSYTLHESIAAGVPVLTSFQSGNIADVVREKGQEYGIVFQNENELFEFLKNQERVDQLISIKRKRYTLEFNPLIK